MKKIVLIDGHSVLNRAFYGISNLSTTEGFPTNAIYGFLSIMFKILEEEQPEYLAVAFDVHKPTFRHKMYDQYKGTRKKMPDELYVQVDKMKEVLKSMNIVCLEKEGYEADDIIGTVSKKCADDSIKVVIVSGDRDLLQLVDDNISVSLAKPMRGNSTTENYNTNTVRQKYGLDPIQIIELKALMGDSSDNIPGLPGVGEKTATAILKEYDNIENAYQNKDKITPNKAKEAFNEHFELAVMSKKLATIVRDVPISINYNELKTGGYFNKTSYLLFKELEFKKFYNRFDIKEELKTTDINTVAVSFSEAGDIIRNKGIYGIAVRKQAIGFCNGNTSYYCIDDKIEELLLIIYELSDVLVTFDTAGICERLNIKDYNGKLFDCSIAAYLLNPLKNTYNYDDIARDYIKINIMSRAELSSVKDNTDSDIKVAAYEAYTAFNAYQSLNNELRNSGMESLFLEIEMPLSVSLQSMKSAGIKIKTEELLNYSNYLSNELKRLQEEIYQQAGEAFNINSPKQLGEILFDKLKLPYAKKTKSGYSTAVDVLDKLKKDYKIVKDVLEFRQFSKFKSTYSDSLPTYVSKDGRIHSDFLQTVTATGRISSANPNLQNIPIRTKLGRSMRKVFVPEEGNCFVDADYSQIELRILAHMSGDENLIKAFNEGEDIHRATAAKVFNVPDILVTDEQRRNAKAVNFGIVYGISPYGLSQDIGISVKDAKKYIEQYFATYPKVERFLEKLKEETNSTGYSYTLFNRRRPVPEISSSNAIQRSFGERIAMNSPIQGTAADIMKIAMNNVHKALVKKSFGARIVLQVHDELLIETPSDRIDEVKEIVKSEMEGACLLKVPLLVDVGSGFNWYETK